MEELNKNQIVLLTLLVSFITSIATGIVTVTLMSQASPAVTQTINRVVERTIEKVIPGEPKVTTVVKEVPVVITEEKLIVDVVNSASAGTVRLVGKDEITLGTGFIASEGGLVATSESVIGTEGESEPVTVVLNNEKTLPARRVKTSAPHGIALLQLALGDVENVTKLNTDESAKTKPVAVLVLSEEAVLPGQTVVAIGRPDKGPINVAGGIVSTLAATSTTELIKTVAANPANIGGPLLNIKGRVVGLNKETGLALSAAMIRDTINAIIK